MTSINLTKIKNKSVYYSLQMILGLGGHEESPKSSLCFTDTDSVLSLWDGEELLATIRMPFLMGELYELLGREVPR